jgi:hypothetical protein
MLKDAYQKILHALIIVERAEPADIPTPTAAHARDRLVRDLRDALQSCGIIAKASHGRELQLIDRGVLNVGNLHVSFGDLTPFENLIDALLIFESESIDGFSRTIRKALHDVNTEENLDLSNRSEASPFSFP